MIAEGEFGLTFFGAMGVVGSVALVVCVEGL